MLTFEVCTIGLFVRRPANRRHVHLTWYASRQVYIMYKVILYHLDAQLCLHLPSSITLVFVVHLPPIMITGFEWDA